MADTQYEPADIEIYVKDKGMVLKEKSLVAYEKSSKKILGIGNEAEALAVQNPESVAVQSPLRQGVIADYVVADLMFRHMLKKAFGKRHFSSPISQSAAYHSPLRKSKKGVRGLDVPYGRQNADNF